MGWNVGYDEEVISTRFPLDFFVLDDTLTVGLTRTIDVRFWANLTHRESASKRCQRACPRYPRKSRRV